MENVVVWLKTRSGIRAEGIVHTSISLNVYSVPFSARLYIVNQFMRGS